MPAAGCCVIVTPLQSRRGTESVLIVEDEPEFLRRFSDAVLADPGLRLHAAVSTGAAAKALLDHNRNPSDAEIRDALDGHICRCGTYPRIVNACREAASAMKGGK